jgi:hypothetical protein
MTDERWEQLMNEPDDEKAVLTSEEIATGWHWCWEYDGMLCIIGDEPGCECELP